MPVQWEGGAFGFLPREEWLNVGFTVTRQNDPIDRLFGDEKTDNLVAYWNNVANEYKIPMMAQFHGFDTEAQKTFRIPVDTKSIEKGLIKVKLDQSERLRQLLKDARNMSEDAIRDFVLNDGIRLADQVFTRSKVAKNELMAYGQVTIKENNLDLTVDYGVPSENLQHTLDLSANADVPAQIQAIVDAAEENGTILNGLLTSRKNLTKMRSNSAIQKAINGTNRSGALVRRGDLNDYLEQEYGLATIVENDLRYGASAAYNAGRPTVTQERYYPANRASFFSTNPAGRMGVGLWGEPPENDVRGFAPISSENSVSPYVRIMQWIENDPAVVWTKASALFMPVLYNPYSLYVATVTY